MTKVKIYTNGRIYKAEAKGPTDIFYHWVKNNGSGYEFGSKNELMAYLDEIFHYEWEIEYAWRQI